MNRNARILAAGATMLFALVLTTGNATARNLYRADGVYDDIDAIVKELKAAKVDEAKVKAAVAGIKKKHEDLSELMTVYKPTGAKVKGIGWDPANKGKGDGIETHINDLAGKKALGKAQFAKEKELIRRATYYNLAMYEIAKAYAPEKIKAGKGAKEWNKYNEEIKEGSKEVFAALEANDPAALKKAMGRIAAGCNECHTDFR